MTNIQAHRGELIKSARKAKKLYQRDIAKKLGKSVSAISSYELGTRCPSLDDAKKLCRILGIKLDQLVNAGQKR